MTDDQLLRQNERESLLIILEYAKTYFKGQLHDSEEGKSIAWPYFKERGFSEATLQAFDLGYSPEAWDAFLKAALKQGFSQEIIEKAGLVTQKMTRVKYMTVFEIGLFSDSQCIGKNNRLRCADFTQ